MTDTKAKTVEQRVLASLRDAPGPMDLDQLIDQVRSTDDQVRGVEVKIAALGLVSKGSVNLNESWQLLTSR